MSNNQIPEAQQLLQPKARFRITPLVMLGALAATGAFCSRQYVRMGPELSANEWGQLTGFGVAMLGFPLLMSVIAFYSAKRSNAAANRVFLGLFLLVALGSTGTQLAQQRERDREVMKDLSAGNRAQNSVILKEMDEKGYVENFDQVTAASVARLEEASKNLSKEGAQVAQAAAQLARRLNKVAGPCNEASKDFIQAGGLDLSGLRTTAEVRERLKLVERFEKTNDAMLKFLVGFDAEARQELRSAGVPAQAVGNVLDGMKKGMKHPTALALR